MPAVRRREIAVGGLTVPRDVFRLALLAAMILTVSRIHQHVGVLAVMRPAVLLVGLALASAFLKPGTLNKNVLRTWPAKSIVLLGIIACISVPFGLSIGNSGKFILESFSKVLVFALLIIAAIKNYRDLTLFVWAFVISCGILVWFSTFVFGLESGGGMERLNDMYTYDANDLGLVLMVGLPLALITYQTSRRPGKIASAAVLVGIGMAMARSGSRGGFLGMVAVGVGLLLLAQDVPLWKRFAFVSGVAVALSIAAPVGYWEQMKTILNPKEDYNWTEESGRKALAQRGVGYMMSRPMTGLGINNFARAEVTISELARQPGRAKGIRMTTAHNSYVQIGAETGFPGLLAWTGIVFGGIVAMLRIRRRIPRRWASGDPEERFLFYCAQYIPVSLVGFAVTAFFVSFAYMDIIYLLAALMAGLYISMEAKRRHGPPFAATAFVKRPVRRTGRLPSFPAQSRR